MVAFAAKGQMKYILVTGGVISGVGKGIIASSTGVLLKGLGLRVTSIKIDPYLNIDAGTLSPYDHGEVFVLDDGGEVDLDLGNYERFMEVNLTKDHNITTGKIYQSVIERERRGDYLGKTVQVVPHITNAIQDWIERVAHIPSETDGLIPQICIVELGGTVGDIESAPFIEAMRQFQFRVGSDNFVCIHVSLVPLVGASGDGEQKTKPTQNSVRELRSAGLSPDILACRSSNKLQDGIKEKLSMFCQVPTSNIFAIHDCSSVYHVPLLLESQNMIPVLMKELLMPVPEPAGYLHAWHGMVNRLDSTDKKMTVAIVGKYTELKDAYMSISKALSHAGIAVGAEVKIAWVDASHLAKESTVPTASCPQTPIADIHAAYDQACAIIVAGGFGKRGVEGKIEACHYARTAKIPFFGICLGFQVAVIEYCRNVLGLMDAQSSEFDQDTSNPVVMFMPEGSKTHMGGTMRLGSRKSIFIGEKLYSDAAGHSISSIDERHRHRYEVNPEYVDRIESSVKQTGKGMLFVARDESGVRMECLELVGGEHPFYVGTQAHPEFKSRPLNPSPFFVGLLKAALVHKSQ